LKFLLQLSYNLMSLAAYGDAFGVTSNTLVAMEFRARKVDCIVDLFTNDVSSFLSGISSFVGFF
jgi:hypothetical protein